MLDYNPDLIADALDEFRAAEAGSSQVPDGPAAVRATVAHRRKVKVTVFSVLGALLILVPIAAFAAQSRDNRPPVVTESGTPEPSPTLSPSPSSSPSPSGPPPRDAKFSKEQLKAAKARVPEQPDWPCSDQFGPEPPEGIEAVRMSVREVVHTNLDNDSTLETAALVTCSSGDLNHSQVVAYDIDAAGAPLLLGAVVNSLAPHDIIDIDRRQGGGVIATVDFSEEIPLPGYPPNQRREFYWDGAAFKQIGGPTAFPPRRRTDLAIAADPLVLEPASDGKRMGSIRVTVENQGPNTSQPLEIELEISGLKVLGEVGDGNMARLPAVRSNTTQTFVISVEVSAMLMMSSFRLSLYSFVEDTKLENNYVEVSINYL